jgi:RNA processing factor Prp31
MANKISIAARVDVYSGKCYDIKEDLLKRVEEIKKKYPVEPNKRRGRKRRR